MPKLILFAVMVLSDVTLSDAAVSLHAVRAGSGRSYPVKTAALAPGARQYADRRFRFSAFPKYLRGATYLQTRNDDKVSRGEGFLRFRVDRPVMVYIAHDNRQPRKPDWMERFQSTGETLNTDDITTRGFALYRRYFPAGNVSLGGNSGPAPVRCMYSVLVVPAGWRNLPPVVEASLDRTLWLPDTAIDLFGSAVDDGQTGRPLVYEWSRVSGPASVRFHDASDPGTRVYLDVPGRYRLRLTVEDGDYTAFDDMEVYVRVAQDPFETAAHNATLAQEAFQRSHRFHTAWLAQADPVTGLIPRGLRGPFIWSGHDAAADCYPFLVLSAALTDRAAFEGPCRAMLETERTLTARLGRLPDVWDLRHQRFHYPEPDRQRIQFGASEYVKDGLLAITEWLGPSTPWSDRMLELVDDCWKFADIETPFGTIVSRNAENNGEMLQVLSRLYWMTGRQDYLTWAMRLGDYYLLGTHHPTRDTPELRLRDHGCEVISGLCELYVTCRFAAPEKAKAYQAPLYEMLDRVLEVGTNAEGFFYDIVNPISGEILRSRLTDTFAYNYNGYYAVYQVDGHQPYRDAVRKLLRALPRYPAFNGAEAMDGNSDALEGALYLFNREPDPALAAWIDHAAQELWSFQKPDGTINRNYLDGNFARSTLLYALWKTQGVTVQPWREDLKIGAVRKAGKLHLFVDAEAPWSGRICFDPPRHRTLLGLPLDWARINQFSPEWFTVEADQMYTLHRQDTGEQRQVIGDVLISGLPVTFEADGKGPIRLEIHAGTASSPNGLDF